jgi:hypothetical protein
MRKIGAVLFFALEEYIVGKRVKIQVAKMYLCQMDVKMLLKEVVQTVVCLPDGPVFKSFYLQFITYVNCR